jgi:formylglycine-generating enzyme required for sulfatase activity
MEEDLSLVSQRDPRGDVFALGRILLRLFTGIPPRESLITLQLNNSEKLRLALSAFSSGAATVNLCKIIQRATHFNPEERYPTAHELLDAFMVAKGKAYSPRRKRKSFFKIEFCRIPKGSFSMGSIEIADEDQSIPMLHKNIKISRSFLLSKTAVTEEMWSKVWGEAIGKEPKLPKEKVSWYDAISFCNAISDAFDLSPCYTISSKGIVWDRAKNGFRLPTEAEWEYACRGGTSSLFYFGNRESDLDRCGWYEKNCEKGPMPVGMKEENKFGLYDMLGNVWEWCWDWFSSLDTQDEIDPIGPLEGTQKVLRGGSWRRSSKFCTCINRYDGDPENKGRSLGFRLARSL